MLLEAYFAQIDGILQKLSDVSISYSIFIILIFLSMLYSLVTHSICLVSLSVSEQCF